MVRLGPATRREAIVCGCGIAPSSGNSGPVSRGPVVLAASHSASQRGRPVVPATCYCGLLGGCPVVTTATDSSISFGRPITPTTQDRGVVTAGVIAISSAYSGEVAVSGVVLAASNEREAAKELGGNILCALPRGMKQVSGAVPSRLRYRISLVAQQRWFVGVFAHSGGIIFQK